MRRKAIRIEACSSTVPADESEQETQAKDVGKVLDDIVSGLASHSDSLLFTGGTAALCLLVAVVVFAPALCPLVFLAFMTFCMPYRVVSFVARKWTFFLVDFCYFANAACAAFLLLSPEDPRLEASLYVLCEGPLAGALLVWQCAWLHGSPNHIVSVLLHQLPGLALFCHRYLAHARRPAQLLARMAAALATAPPAAGGAGGAGLWVAESGGAAATVCDASGGGGDGTCPAGAATGAAGAAADGAFLASLPGRIAAAAAVARGRVPCPASSGAEVAGGGGGGGVGCFSLPAAPSVCPAPAWLWLAVAPLAFYAAWQVAYFLVVQVACRRFILAHGYDTSYRCLARRAQRADNGLNRLVRSGSAARRLAMYGLLQLLYSVAAGALALPTYRWFGVAALWQVVKLAVPVYLGACHQCQRLPEQQLRAAAAQLAAAGLLPPPAVGRAATAAAAAAATVVVAASSCGGDGGGVDSDEGGADGPGAVRKGSAERVPGAATDASAGAGAGTGTGQ